MYFSDTASPSVKDKINRQLVRSGLKQIPYLPSRFIFSQFSWFIKDLMQIFPYEEVGFMHTNNPFYIFDIDGEKLTVCKGGFAPVIVQVMEEAIALGASEFIINGTCGSLEKAPSNELLYLIDDVIAADSISQYYQGSTDLSRTITIENSLTQDLQNFCEKQDYHYLKVKGWTMNALYLQVEELRNKALKQDVKCVDGELASVFSVANYRKVKCGAALFWSDLVAETNNYRSRDILPETESYQYYKDFFIELCKWFTYK